jgi:hypothetical protein
MTAARLAAIRDLIQEDINHRGLSRDPEVNLLSACSGDFAAACQMLARGREGTILIVTGFFIPYGEPPAAETDGPLGAVFLARALTALSSTVAIGSDPFCLAALRAGLRAVDLDGKVPVVALPEAAGRAGEYFEAMQLRLPAPLMAVVAIERAGPNHTAASLRGQPGYSAGWTEGFEHEVPPDLRDRCLTMRGWDVTGHLRPAHLLFEAARAASPSVFTIGIGDGGNEIGMGKIPWPIIRANIPRGGLIACRVPVDYLVVAGISNWGAYGLTAGTHLLHGKRPPDDLFDPEREREVLEIMVNEGPLVDGVTGKPAITVDGLAFERYAEVLPRLRALLGQG